MPHPNPNRSELLALGADAGFPRCWYRTTEGIDAGRDAWERFAANVGTRRLTEALTAARQLAAEGTDK
jgi:hypothetical protein